MGIVCTSIQHLMSWVCLLIRHGGIENQQLTCFQSSWALAASYDCIYKHNAQLCIIQRAWRNITPNPAARCEVACSIFTSMSLSGMWTVDLFCSRGHVVSDSLLFFVDVLRLGIWFLCTHAVQWSSVSFVTNTVVSEMAAAVEWLRLLWRYALDRM